MHGCGGAWPILKNRDSKITKIENNWLDVTASSELGLAVENSVTATSEVAVAAISLALSEELFSLTKAATNWASSTDVKPAHCIQHCC